MWMIRYPCAQLWYMFGLEALEIKACVVTLQDCCCKSENDCDLSQDKAAVFDVCNIVRTLPCINIVSTFQCTSIWTTSQMLCPTSHIPLSFIVHLIYSLCCPCPTFCIKLKYVIHPFVYVTVHLMFISAFLCHMMSVFLELIFFEGLLIIHALSNRPLHENLVSDGKTGNKY